MVADLLLGSVALLLLIFPGWLIARARRMPVPGLAGFVVGAISLILLVQLLEAVGAELSIQTLLPAWLALSLGSFLLCNRSATTPIPVAPPAKEWWLVLPLAPAIAVVAYRAIAQPLFGVDTIFRWNFLAEEMLYRGTLAFYPPVTASDYAIYAWPDGIAPVVSCLYFWVYSMAGAGRAVLTAPLIIFQFILILAAVYELARQLASPRSAAIASALTACSPILLWSTAMGQESGLLSIALLGILIYLPSSREKEKTALTILAGLAAAMGRLAREYGLSFIAFGLILSLCRRLSPRTSGIFLITAVAATVPWYVRNWLHTGNPFFNLDVAGLFPVNTAQLRLIKIYQASFGWEQLPPKALRIFTTNCMAATLAVAAGGLLYFKRGQSLLGAIVVVSILWAISLGYTAAGFIYSLRVLAPAMAIAAVLGGMAFARWIPGRTHLTGLIFALAAFASDSALRALVLPANVYNVPISAWLTAGGAVHEYHQRPVYRQLANFAGKQRILVLGPTALLNQNGALTLPLWSPEVAFLWEKSVDTPQAIQLLNKNRIGFFLANKGEVNRAYLAQIAFFNRPTGTPLQKIWEDDDMTLFKVPAPFPATESKPLRSP